MREIVAFDFFIYLFIYFILVFYSQILEEAPEVDEADEGAIEDDKPAVELAKKMDERRWSVVAQKILMEAVVAGDSDETLKRLKKASDNLVGWRGMITQNLFSSHSAVFCWQICK